MLKCIHCALIAGLILLSPVRGLAGDRVPMLFIHEAITPEEMAARIAAPLPGVNPDAPKGGVLRVSSIGTFDNFNIFSPRGLPPGYLALSYETLGTDDGYDENGVRGLLAESFEIAEDRTWMKVFLRPEARFADGTPVLAEDVKYTFDALVSEGSPTYRNYYAQVDRVEVEAPLVAVFYFKSAKSRELPLIVSQLPVLPRHWWAGKSLGDPQNEAFPGSGPYQVAGFEKGSSLTLARNPDWWGADLPVNRGRYNFDTIAVDYYRSVDVARESFLAGEFDIYFEYTMRSWVSAYDTPAVQDGRIVKEEWRQDRPQGMTGFFFNTRREMFKDRRVRRAISLCFDFEWTNKALFFDAYARCSSFFSNSRFAAPELPDEAELAILEPLRDKLAPEVFGPLPAWPKSDGSGFPRDRMREVLGLLKSAGWNLQNGIMQDASGRQLKFTLLLVSPTMQRVAMPFRANLQRLGIAMEIEIPDQTQYINRVRQFDYDMMMGSVHQSNDPGNEQSYFWSSWTANAQGSRNYAGIADPAVDALIDVVIAAPDRKSQIAAVHALDRVLQHGSYVLPGWYGPRIHFARWADRIDRPEQSSYGGGVDIFRFWSAGAKPTSAGSDGQD